MSSKSQDYRIWENGDKYLLVDFGLGSNIVEFNIKAVLLKISIEEQNLAGITELVPSNTSLLVGYEPDLIDVTELKEELTVMLDDIMNRENLTIPSRLIEIPVLFNDPWTNDCVEKYSNTIKAIDHNIEKIIRDNGLGDLNELVYYYTFPQFWVTYVGFWPGLASAVCLDPRYILSVEKYNPPRTYTPAGAIGIGGSNTSIYPMESPGGFQLFGITPVPIYYTGQKLAAFKDSVVLFKVTDRIKFNSIDIDQFHIIKKQVEQGTYRYNIIEYEQFDLNRYNQFRNSLLGGGAE